MSTIIRLDRVSYRYPDGVDALQECSLEIGRGTRMALLGANGVGKTTLFLHLNGILRPASGRLFYDGTEFDYSRSGMRRLRTKVGLVFQNPDSQLFSASVREDVSFGPLNLGLTEQEVRQRVEEALAVVGLAELGGRPVHNLSYGQKKRVCIAGVLAMRPEVLILDEPMAGLDGAMQAELTQVLDRLHAVGMTILLATHDMDFAYQWADRLTVMTAGRCAASWEVTQLSQCLHEVTAYGLGLPKVAELQHQLTAVGIIPPATPVLRSHSSLMRLLNGLSTP